MRNPFTTGRVLVGLYVVGVVITILMLDGPKPSLHLQASRDLGIGTRVTRDMLVAPQRYPDFDDKLRLRGEARAMLGAYLTVAVPAGCMITPALVRPWPDPGAATLAVALPAGANWQMYNQGALVRFGAGDARRQTRVVAVVPLDYDGDDAKTAATPAGWMLFLDAVDTGGKALARPAEAIVPELDLPAMVFRLPDAERKSCPEIKTAPKNSP
jgi:hypothetical protein